MEKRLPLIQAQVETIHPDKEPCVSPDERDQNVDDWWNDLEDGREEVA